MGAQEIREIRVVRVQRGHADDVDIESGNGAGNNTLKKKGE